MSHRCLLYAVWWKSRMQHRDIQLRSFFACKLRVIYEAVALSAWRSQRPQRLPNTIHKIYVLYSYTDKIYSHTHKTYSYLQIAGYSFPFASGSIVSFSLVAQNQMEPFLSFVRHRLFIHRTNDWYCCAASRKEKILRSLFSRSPIILIHTDVDPILANFLSTERSEDYVGWL